MENVFFMKCPDCKRVFAAIEKQLNYTYGSRTFFVSCPQKYSREERLVNPARKCTCTGYPEYPKCVVDEAEYKKYIAEHPEHYEEDNQNMYSARNRSIPEETP